MEYEDGQNINVPKIHNLSNENMSNDMKNDLNFNLRSLNNDVNNDLNSDQKGLVNTLNELYNKKKQDESESDNSFYASLAGKFIAQNHENVQAKMRTPNNNNSTSNTNKSSYNNEANTTIFMDFLSEIREDYQNANPQLCNALNKFAEHYRAAKNKSIPRLNLLNDAKQMDQGINEKLPENSKNKENYDPQVIPSRKKDRWQKRSQFE
ncbi:12932_t:CDS:2 [Gigaspora rosea]|nr:12932_t:CDS:2 [Gigaspora rosea]